jgi:hypothetical protein
MPKSKTKVRRRGRPTREVTQKRFVRQKIADAIEPDAWKEFRAGKGTCSNMAGRACLESIYAANRVMKVLASLNISVTDKKSARR